ncbi:site-specific integrase [Streptococcus anginosus]|jgi:integrase|uniref:tyrosine-type recombinase/integrase n=4 Tax=Streptococcus TaxID=1301 RepID=UPI000C7A86A2|nr:site-specific integrase [Streptococcus anginosus]HER9557997.1 site-specific integrase [Streptococcus pyogenes]KAA9252101.1 site-specific integrase [Streptococcus anginosus]KAA9308716.1 site-specific integrase [Streptococcus anginosus]MBU5590090.1 site-specific integrase [Streptococcus anginosus]MDB8649091.1 tyrosine-type recombinase/integrase [Streptococcus anginosus]
MWTEQLPNGKIKFFERYKNPYTNKWRRVSVTLETDTSRARKKAQRILDEKIKLKLISLSTSDMTLLELYNMWFPYYKKLVKRSSWIKVEPMMKHIYRYIPKDVLIAKIDEDLVYKLIDNMYTFGTLSLNYTKQTRTTLSTMLNFAISKKLISSNPVLKTKVAPKKEEEARIRKRIEDKYLENEEFKQILEYMYSKPKRKTHALISEVLYLTGLRYGELQALRVRDYDGKTLSVNGTLDYTSVKISEAKKTTPKNLYSYRKIDLPNRVIEIIEEFLLENRLLVKGYNDDSFIFLASHKKNPLSLRSFNSVLASTEEELHFKKHLTSHIFRHSHISLLSELNLPLKVIMERVGHSDPKTTLAIYNHVTKNARKNAIDALNKL